MVIKWKKSERETESTNAYCAFSSDKTFFKKTRQDLIC